MFVPDSGWSVGTFNDCPVSGLSKEAVTLDDIDTVVITHGHPGHMGNMNFFGQKPILFHSMEYIGRHVTPTELRDVSLSYKRKNAVSLFKISH